MSPTFLFLPFSSPLEATQENQAKSTYAFRAIRKTIRLDNYPLDNRFCKRLLKFHGRFVDFKYPPTTCMPNGTIIQASRVNKFAFADRSCQRSDQSDRQVAKAVGAPICNRFCRRQELPGVGCKKTRSPRGLNRSRLAFPLRGLRRGHDRQAKRLILSRSKHVDGDRASILPIS